MNEYIGTFLLSMLPIFELRGGIPFGIFSGLNPIVVYLIAVTGNLLVIIFGFFFLDFFHKYFLKISLYKRVFEHFLERARRKAHAKIEKYGYLGLFLFVAIPLPVTGAYTGTLVAWFFKMRGKKTYIALGLGVITAGLIVTAVSLTGGAAFSIFIK